MIFLGDIAVPSVVKPKIDVVPKNFCKQKVIANLEGPIVEDKNDLYKKSVVFSNTNVLEFLSECNIKAVSCANNHMFDLGNSFEETASILKQNNISYFGAGNCLLDAQKPYIITEDGSEYVVLAFGWDVISCIYATDINAGVNPLEYTNIMICVEKAKKEHPLAKIITIMHWDYELEKYPMPAHRKLAHELIDEWGVFAVIGHHPHCVQGIEIYKKHVIAYSLGNWFIPEQIYMNKKLQFPKYANEEFALEISNNCAKIHRFCFEPENNKIRYMDSYNLLESLLIQEYTPFSKLTNIEYVSWFKRNRKKKRLLPIFKEYDNRVDSFVKKNMVFFRQYIVNFLFSIGIKKRSRL